MLEHVRVLPLLAIVAIPVVVAGAGCESPEPIHEAVTLSRATAPIIGGSVEPGLDATVAMVVDYGGGNLVQVCSGTIVKVDGSTGYVLTAAHCGQIDYVLQADSYDLVPVGGGGEVIDCSNSTCTFYPVVDSAIHESWNENTEQGTLHDFQMLAFADATAATPVVPVASSDGLAQGDDITLAGYGLRDGGGGLTSSDARRSVANTVGDFDGFRIYYEQSNGGPGGVCFGDSGGPTYKTLGGELRVVGVNQAVAAQAENSCEGYGISGRVTAVSAFIADFLDEVPPPVDCGQCFQIAVSSAGECAAQVDTCFGSDGNTPCGQLAACINACGTQVCVNGCAADHPSGVAPYNAIIDCAYCDACATECAGENDFCNDPSSTSAGPGPTTSVGVTTGGGDTTAVGATSSTGDSVLGTGGGGAGGANGGDDDDGGNGDDDGDSGATATDEGGCTVAAAGSAAGASAKGSGGGAGLLLVGAAALAASRRRRR